MNYTQWPIFSSSFPSVSYHSWSRIPLFISRPGLQDVYTLYPHRLYLSFFSFFLNVRVFLNIQDPGKQDIRAFTTVFTVSYFSDTDLSRSLEFNQRQRGQPVSTIRCSSAQLSSRQRSAIVHLPMFLIHFASSFRLFLLRCSLVRIPSSS
ncbi:hypothetical protein C8J56DRAFT_258859 [Mycena floridula]|nr:hypothetical protein C8J56DRAFT_258859 [Mycena floridula]